MASEPWVLDRSHDAHGEIRLAGQRAYGGGDGVRGHAREGAEEAPAVEAPGVEALRNGEHHLAVWYARR